LSNIDRVWNPGFKRIEQNILPTTPERRVPEGNRLSTRRFGSHSPYSESWNGLAEHKLIWGVTGMVTLQVGDQTILLPPATGFWVPAKTAHSLLAKAGASYIFTYFDPRNVELGWLSPLAISIRHILRELILDLHLNGMPEHIRAASELLIIAMLKSAERLEVALPMPSSPRLLVVSRELLANPADDRPLDFWAAEAALTPRSFARQHVKQTGITFGQWRILVKLRMAQGLLAQGQPVKDVAARVGYTSTSAFIAAFQKRIGMTPGTLSGTNAAPSDRLELAFLTGQDDLL